MRRSPAMSRQAPTPVLCCRDFVARHLPQLKSQHPDISIETEVKRNRHPCVEGQYGGCVSPTDVLQAAGILTVFLSVQLMGTCTLLG